MMDDYRIGYIDGAASRDVEVDELKAERDAYMRDYGKEQDRKREVAQQLASRDAEIAELKAENESLLKNLRGKHSITGATYTHLIEERDQLREQMKMLRDVVRKSRLLLKHGRCKGDILSVDMVAACDEALAATEPK